METAFSWLPLWWLCPAPEGQAVLFLPHTSSPSAWINWQDWWWCVRPNRIQPELPGMPWLHSADRAGKRLQADLRKLDPESLKRVWAAGMGPRDAQASSGGRHRRTNDVCTPKSAGPWVRALLRLPYSSGRDGSSPAWANPVSQPPFALRVMPGLEIRRGGWSGPALRRRLVCSQSGFRYRSELCAAPRWDGQHIPAAISPLSLAWGTQAASRRQHGGSGNAEGEEFHPRLLYSRARPLGCSRKKVSGPRGHPSASMSLGAADGPGCPCAHWSG